MSNKHASPADKADIRKSYKDKHESPVSETDKDLGYKSRKKKTSLTATHGACQSHTAVTVTTTSATLVKSPPQGTITLTHPATLSRE